MVLGFSTKDKPKRPLYEEQQDTPWITRNRNLNEKTYNNVYENLDRVNVFDDATKQSLQNYADDIYNRALSDFNRSYNQTMNKTLSRDYNRFGTTGASTSLLNRDNYNLQQQRKLADLAYDKALYNEDLINNELQRRYNTLNTNYNYFTNSGKTTQDFDNANWQIRNMNKDVQYLNDIQDYNNSFEHKTDQLAHQIGGAVASIWLGPAGIALGNMAQNTFASDAEAYGQGMIGNYTNAYNNYTQSPFGNNEQKSLSAWYQSIMNGLGNNYSTSNLWGNQIPLSQLGQYLYSGNYGYSLPDIYSGMGYGSLVDNPYWTFGYNNAG